MGFEARYDFKRSEVVKRVGAGTLYSTHGNRERFPDANGRVFRYAGTATVTVGMMLIGGTSSLE